MHAPGNTVESRKCEPRLATALFSFSHLSLGEALREISALKLPLVDVGVFPDRHQVRTAEVMADPVAAAGRLRSLLDAEGLGVGDVFFHPGAVPRDVAVNHPDPAARAEAARRFAAALAFAVALRAVHMTTLPGVLFGEGDSGQDVDRAAGGLARWLARARDAGIRFGVEPHLGSLMETPDKALLLVERVPGLELTLDPSHFVCGGQDLTSIAPLHRFATWTHVRPARRGRLQCALRDSEFDLADFVRAFAGNAGVVHTLEIVAGRPPLCEALDPVETIREITAMLKSNVP